MFSTTRIGIGLTVALFAATTSAAPPRPSGAHPRLWVTSQVRDAWADLAGQPGSHVASAIGRCDRLRTDPEDGGWQGANWAAALSSCLVAYMATDAASHAATAIVYLEALLDDYQNLGDGAGGDDVVRHDTGYAMRNFGAFAAIGYDWLYNAPGMTETIRSRALSRFDAWASYYRNGGYLNDEPGANYHAGWVIGATTMAVAGEDTDLWAHVVDTMFNAELLPAMSSGVLEGGDWPEGWQYGPLSVMSYAASARTLVDHGVELVGLEDWTRDITLRHVYGLTPDGQRTFAGGDTSATEVHIEASHRALYAPLLAPATDQVRGWAMAELDNMGNPGEERILFSALIEAMGYQPTSFPRESAPTAYLAPGTGNFYLRGNFGDNALWAVLQCSSKRIPDHTHLNAGNFVMSRGSDDLLIDPSPYGTMSSLTSNAPTVRSDRLSESYQPSQGPWGESTGFLWARQVASGVAAARCDYRDQYRRTNEATDINVALRDTIVLPSDVGGTAVVLDRADTGDASRFLDLRFRTIADLSDAGDVASGDVGDSTIHIHSVYSTDSAPQVRTLDTNGDCSNVERGQCDYSRVEGEEMALRMNGPNPRSIFVVDAVAKGTARSEAVATEGDGYNLVVVESAGRGYSVVDLLTGAAAYSAPAGTMHIVLGGPTGAEGRSAVSATRVGNDCQVSIAAAAGTETGFNGLPLIFVADESCKLTEEAEAPGFEVDEPNDSTGESGGCGCDTPGQPGSSAALLTLLALLGISRKRWPHKAHRH